MISGGARLAGVIGWPVAHSRSPLLHGLWLQRHGIDGAYVPLAVRPEELETAVRGLAACGFRGANVTVPHKEAVMALCTRLDDTARAAGAVNTLIFSETGIEGRNSDGMGFAANLAGHGIQLRGHALILGAGGAARAIAAELHRQGMRVTLTNRSEGRAEALAASLAQAMGLPPGMFGTVDWASREAALAEVNLLINTTSLGMHGKGTPISLARAPETLAVADIVYVPKFTPLLLEAATRGLAIVPGLGMLLHQAVPGFAAWFGLTPQVDAEIHAAVGADIPERAAP